MLLNWQTNLTEQVDLFRTAEEKSTSFGAMNCSIMSLLLQRGAGWGVWGKPFPYPHLTHISILKKPTALTWSPPNRSFLPAAEADFAENPQEMPLAQRAGVLAGAGTTFRSRDPVAV